MIEKSALHESRWLIAVGILLPLLLLVGLSFLAGSAVRKLETTSAQVEYLHDIENTSQRLLNEMVNNEAGQRGYILAQNVLFLEPYNLSLKHIPTHIGSLSKGVWDDKGREIFTTLTRSIEDRLAFSAKTVEMQRAGDHNGSIALIQTGQGKKLMDRVRVDFANFDTYLRSQIDSALRGYSDLLRRNRAISWSLVGLHLVFLAILTTIYRRLRRTEQFVHICAWSRTIQHEGEWISFEEYLEKEYNLSISHGISPAEAKKLLSHRNKEAA